MHIRFAATSAYERVGDDGAGWGQPGETSSSTRDSVVVLVLGVPTMTAVMKDGRKRKPSKWSVCMYVGKARMNPKKVFYCCL